MSYDVHTLDGYDFYSRRKWEEMWRSLFGIFKQEMKDARTRIARQTHEKLMAHAEKQFVPMLLEKLTSEVDVEDTREARRCGKCLIWIISLFPHFEGHVADHDRPPKPRHHKCDTCLKCFTQKGHLTVHIRIHTGEKPFRCNVCPKAFAQSGDLTKHMRIHTGQKPFKCRFCKRRFSESCNLNVHLRIHYNIRPFKCPQCRKRFNQKGNLTTHLRQHTKERPFQCDVCSKKFMSSGNLTVHRRVHSGEKPYECKECSKAFKDKSTLTRHMVVHTGERNFRCTFCDKTYTQGPGLLYHQKKEHFSGPNRTTTYSKVMGSF